jgi:hypothetical protein
MLLRMLMSPVPIFLLLSSARFAELRLFYAVLTPIALPPGILLLVPFVLVVVRGVCVGAVSRFMPGLIAVVFLGAQWGLRKLLVAPGEGASLAAPPRGQGAATRWQRGLPQ